MWLVLDSSFGYWCTGKTRQDTRKVERKVGLEVGMSLPSSLSKFTLDIYTSRPTSQPLTSNPDQLTPRPVGRVPDPLATSLRLLLTRLAEVVTR